jgi:hypothetical protein
MCLPETAGRRYSDVQVRRGMPVVGSSLEEERDASRTQEYHGLNQLL